MLKHEKRKMDIEQKAIARTDKKKIRIVNQ